MNVLRFCCKYLHENFAVSRNDLTIYQQKTPQQTKKEIVEHLHVCKWNAKISQMCKTSMC